jgi:chlorite dismutase
VAGQYVAYTFYKVDSAWRRLPVEERTADKDAFAEVLEDWAGRMVSLRTYSVAGIRPDADLFLWKITERYEDLGELGAALNATPLAGWLSTPYSYLATTKASEYTKARKPRQVVPRGSPYLVVYPFVKVRPWYALPPEDRQRAMDEHMRIGHEFSTIVNHTTYSFGIDDQEFMTAFECEEPADFMHLMLTLRDSEASRYTERDTPIFVGRSVEIREALDELDGAAMRVEAQ